MSSRMRRGLYLSVGWCIVDYGEDGSVGNAIVISVFDFIGDGDGDSCDEVSLGMM